MNEINRAGVGALDSAEVLSAMTPDEVLAAIRKTVDAEIAKAAAALPEARRGVAAAAEAVALANTRLREFEARIRNLLARLEATRGRLTPLIAEHRIGLEATLRNANVAHGKAREKVSALEASLRALGSADDQLKFIGA